MKVEDVPEEWIAAFKNVSFDFIGTPSNALHALTWADRWGVKKRAIQSIIAAAIRAMPDEGETP